MREAADHAPCEAAGDSEELGPTFTRRYGRRSMSVARTLPGSLGGDAS